MKFTYSNPTTIFFGAETINKITRAIPRQSKILLVYGGGSIKKNGVYEQICGALSEHDWDEFSGVEPNPSVETLNQAVSKIKAENFTYILAAGGGSVIDGCKYIAAASCYDGDGWDILTRKHKVTEALPFGAILTLPATGSESNGGAVITRQASGEKLVFSSDHVFPQFAVLDPNVIKSLPPKQLANGIVDAFVHVCEQYLTYPDGGWVQDGYAETLLKNLVALAAQFNERDSDIWRENLMWTTNQALNGLIGAGVPNDWATHMIGHELTALYGLDHARSLAIVHPHLLRAMLNQKKVKLAKLGRTVFNLVPDIFLAETTIKSIEKLYQDLGIATTLKQAGIDDTDAAEKVTAALAKHGMDKLGEKGEVTLEVSAAIIEKALG